MNCRTGRLCLLAAIASAGCQRTDGLPTSAPAGDGTPPHPPAARLPEVRDPAAAGEFKKFEGTWVVTAAQLDGDDLPDQLGQEYTFAAGRLTLRKGERVLDTARVVLVPSAKPKAVDLVSDYLREGESPARFIYEFDGEVLRLCRGDKDRPTSFAGKDQIVFTLRRKKG
jgi:uncharacterized protein (TIGR03067 family)